MRGSTVYNKIMLYINTVSNCTHTIGTSLHYTTAVALAAHKFEVRKYYIEPSINILSPSVQLKGEGGCPIY